MEKSKVEELLRKWLKVVYTNESKYKPEHYGFICYVSHEMKLNYWYRDILLVSYITTWHSGEITSSKEEFISWIIDNFEDDCRGHAKTIKKIVKKIEMQEKKLNKGGK